MTAHQFVRRGEREIYRGHIFNLVEASFESPDGEHFVRDIVRTRGAVASVPITYAAGDASRETPIVTLLAQYRPPFDDVVIEVPAGMRDVDGEADEANARRELVEEVGLSPGRLDLLARVYPSPGMTDSVHAIYLATACTPVERAPHGPEERSAEIVTVPLAEALSWVETGRIHNSTTVVGLLLAERRLRVGG